MKSDFEKMYLANIKLVDENNILKEDLKTSKETIEEIKKFINTKLQDDTCSKCARNLSKIVNQNNKYEER